MTDKDWIEKKLQQLEEMADEVGVNREDVRSIFNQSSTDEEKIKGLESVKNILQHAESSGLGRYFDESEVVQNEILPLWEKIYALCEKNSIPVLFAISQASNEKDGSHAAVGNVLIKRRTPEKFVMAHRLLSDNAKLVEMDGSDLLGVLTKLKDGMEKPSEDCDCPECTARRTSMRMRKGNKESVDA